MAGALDSQGILTGNEGRTRCHVNRPQVGSETAHKGKGSTSAMDIELELAIALTNANINSGRVVYTPPAADCARRPGNAEQAGRLQPTPPITFGRSTAVSTISHYEDIHSCASKCAKPISWPVRVVWSHPLELRAGPGYSPAAGSLGNRVCSRQSSTLHLQSEPRQLQPWPSTLTTICNGNWLEQFNRLSSSSPPGDSVATEDGGKCGGDVRSKSRLVAKPLARMRTELYARLGVVDSRVRAPEKAWLPVCSSSMQELGQKLPEEVPRDQNHEAAGVLAESRFANVPVGCVLRDVEVVGGGRATDEQRDRSVSFGSSSSSFLSSTSTLAASYTGLLKKSPLLSLCDGPASPTAISPTSPVSPGSEGSRLSFERGLVVEDFDFRSTESPGLYFIGGYF